MVAQVTSDDLGAKLAAGPVAVYHGIDASADSLHVGNLIGVLVLGRLQAAGHRPVVLLGGGLLALDVGDGVHRAARHLAGDGV